MKCIDSNDLKLRASTRLMRNITQINCSAFVVFVFFQEKKTKN